MSEYLFILRHPPHQGLATPEKLDALLTCAAFDQKVSLLFLDDGVFQLKKQQQTADLGVKDTLSMFKALELYDINALYVETQSLLERGLSVTDLALPVQTLLRCEINTLLQQFAIIT